MPRKVQEADADEMIARLTELAQDIQLAQESLTERQRSLVLLSVDVQRMRQQVEQLNRSGSL